MIDKGFVEILVNYRHDFPVAFQPTTIPSSPSNLMPQQREAFGDVLPPAKEVISV
ncbi:hypothetical protein DXG03_002572, partial [Asterophora parasitica]